MEVLGRRHPVTPETVNQYTGIDKMTLNLDEGRILTVERPYLAMFPKDNIKWGGSDFDFCFVATGKKEAKPRYASEYTFTVGSALQCDVDLAGAANRGFADEIAEDGKVGWTDQGPGNDLYMLPSGLLKNGVMRFSLCSFGRPAPAPNAVRRVFQELPIRSPWDSARVGMAERLGRSIGNARPCRRALNMIGRSSSKKAFATGGCSTTPTAIWKTRVFSNSKA